MAASVEGVTPDEYIDSLEEPRRSEIRRLHELIRETAPDREPHIRSGMLGYGPYRYRYESGREGEWFLIGLASRKRCISVYVQCSREGEYLVDSYRERLPRADIGKACVRFRRLDDVDLGTLRDLVAEAAAIGPAAAAG